MRPKTNFIQTKITCFILAPPATFLHSGQLGRRLLQPEICEKSVGNHKNPNTTIGKNDRAKTRIHFCMGRRVPSLRLESTKNNVCILFGDRLYATPASTFGARRHCLISGEHNLSCITSGHFAPTSRFRKMHASYKGGHLCPRKKEP